MTGPETHLFRQMMKQQKQKHRRGGMMERSLSRTSIGKVAARWDGLSITYPQTVSPTVPFSASCCHVSSDGDTEGHDVAKPARAIYNAYRVLEGHQPMLGSKRKRALHGFPMGMGLSPRLPAFCLCVTSGGVAVVDSGVLTLPTMVSRPVYLGKFFKGSVAALDMLS